MVLRRVRCWPCVKRKVSARSVGTSKETTTASSVSGRTLRTRRGWKWSAMSVARVDACRVATGGARRCGAAGGARPCVVAVGARRCGAAVGARRWRRLRRSARSADSAAMLGLRSRRETRCVRCAHSAQTVATSQLWMRAARADRSPALLAATDSAPDGHRLPRATAGLVAAKKTGAGAKARSGRSRSASGAPRSAGLAARARSTHPPLTRRRCLSGESAANAASSATGPRDRASQGSRRTAPTAPAKRSGLPGRDFAARTVELHLFFFIVMAALERAPQQDRNDQREDDHFLEGAGVVRAEAFEQADEHGADRRARVAGEAAEDRGDESLETDQETGVVEDRGRRADQQTRERADEGRQGEAELAGAGGG